MNRKILALTAAACLAAAACDRQPQVTAENEPADTADITRPTPDQPSSSSPSSTSAVTPPSSGAPGQRGANVTTGVSPAVPGQSTTAAGAAPRAASGAAPATAPGTPASLDTQTYLRSAAIGDLYEIEAGQLALDRSDSEEVRELAQMLVDDHEELSADLMQALSSSSVSFTPPTALDARHEALIAELEEATDEAFDETFLRQQQTAHLEALTLHRNYATRGDVSELKSAAAAAVPVIEEHRDHVGAAMRAAAEAGG